MRTHLEYSILVEYDKLAQWCIGSKEQQKKCKDQDLDDYDIFEINLKSMKLKKSKK